MANEDFGASHLSSFPRGAESRNPNDYRSGVTNIREPGMRTHGLSGLTRKDPPFAGGTMPVSFRLVGPHPQTAASQLCNPHRSRPERLQLRQHPRGPPPV